MHPDPRELSLIENFKETPHHSIKGQENKAASKDLRKAKEKQDFIVEIDFDIKKLQKVSGAPVLQKKRLKN